MPNFFSDVDLVFFLGGGGGGMFSFLGVGCVPV